MTLLLLLVCLPVSSLLAVGMSLWTSSTSVASPIPTSLTTNGSGHSPLLPRILPKTTGYLQGRWHICQRCRSQHGALEGWQGLNGSSRSHGGFQGITSRHGRCRILCESIPTSKNTDLLRKVHQASRIMEPLHKGRRKLTHAVQYRGGVHIICTMEIEGCRN